MSDHGLASSRAVWRRILPVAVIVVCAGAGSFALVLAFLGGNSPVDLFRHATGPNGTAATLGISTGQSGVPPQAADQLARAAPPAAGKSPAEKRPDELPRFDIVRVAPSGSAVVAGRAAPDAEVTISDNGAALGRTRADSRGEWVFVPQTALAPGGRELTLASRAADGTALSGDAPVLVIVPAQAAPLPGSGATPVAAPVVVLAPRDEAPRLLQSPVSAGDTAASRAQLGLDVVDYDDQGAIRFTGRAPAGAAVRVYIDDKAAGDAGGDTQGRWTLTPSGPVEAGDHRLRVDQVSDGGRVLARVELPFQRVHLTPEMLGKGRVIVQPRQTLWALARRAYGEGVRYTVIYEANREQIRDPGLIYPGQIFALPAGSSGTASPRPASSTSLR